MNQKRPIGISIDCGLSIFYQTVYLLIFIQNET